MISASSLTVSPRAAGSTRSSPLTPSSNPAAVKTIGAVIGEPSTRADTAANASSTSAMAGITQSKASPQSRPGLECDAGSGPHDLAKRPAHLGDTTRAGEALWGWRLRSEYDDEPGSFLAPRLLPTLERQRVAAWSRRRRETSRRITGLAPGTGSNLRFASETKDPLLTRTVPVTAELPRYRFPRARRDVIAGVTVAALALPAAMAYAEVAGVSPVNGLYALLLPAVAYALLGSSRQLSVGPEGSVSTLVGAAVLGVAVAGSPEAAELAATLAVLVGACASRSPGCSGSAGSPTTSRGPCSWATSTASPSSS